jgi:hypothetical protein
MELKKNVKSIQLVIDYEGVLHKEVKDLPEIEDFMLTSISNNSKSLGLTVTYVRIADDYAKDAPWN